MDKTENVLYSLIPLVIIVLISWLFSYLASKRRKDQGSVETEHDASPGSQFLQFLSGDHEADEEIAVERDMRRTDTVSNEEMHTWTPDVPRGGPKVTPKPIEPKWWGS